MSNNNSFHAAAKNPLKKILIIENDADLLNVYLTRLKAEGFSVRSLLSGKNAVKEAENYRPDLILLDIMLPEKNGLDILEELRHNPKTAGIKVIIVTVLAREAEQTRAEQLGAAEYLVKSFIILSDVIEHVKEHLGITTPLEEEDELVEQKA